MPETPLSSDRFPPEHYQAIGEFITHYGLFESLFFRVFRRYSGLPEDVARAIVGGNRIKDLIERTKRVMHLKKVDEKLIKQIEGIESVLNVLSPFRDKLVHRVWLPLEGGPSVVNLLSGKTIESAFTPEVITTEQIRDADYRLFKLTLYLFPHAMPEQAVTELWKGIAASMSQEDLEALVGASPDIPPGPSQSQ